MKKLIGAIMAIAMITALCACNNTTSNGTTAPAAQTTAPQTTAPAETQPTETSPAFEEIILADEENITVKITGIEEDNIWGYTLKVFLENKTDKELMFTVDSVSVNGFMCDPFWAVTVAPGMKANEKISISETDFADNGIETVENITFTLRSYDSNDFMADDLFHQTFTINP